MTTMVSDESPAITAFSDTVSYEILRPRSGLGCGLERIHRAGLLLRWSGYPHREERTGPSRAPANSSAPRPNLWGPPGGCQGASLRLNASQSHDVRLRLSHLRPPRCPWRQAEYESPETFYAFGWSHGREKLQGKPDFAKGSFYANPQYDRPVEDEELIKAHAPFIHPNIWPAAHLPELEPAFKALGQVRPKPSIHQTTRLTK